MLHGFLIQEVQDRKYELDAKLTLLMQLERWHRWGKSYTPALQVQVEDEDLEANFDYPIFTIFLDREMK